MVEGRQRDQWQHTAEVLAMIANTVRNPKKRRRPFTGKMFYPFGKQQRQPKGMPVSIKDIVTRYGLRKESGTQGES